MEDQSLEELNPAADSTFTDNSEEHGDVVETEAADTVLDSEEAPVPGAEVSTGLDAERTEASVAEERLDPVPEEGLAEEAELQTAGEEPEEATPLPDQPAGGDLPTSEAFEEGEAPDVDPLIGERLSRESSIKAEEEEPEEEEPEEEPEEEDEGPAVLDPGSPEPEIEEEQISSDELQTEKHNLQSNYEEQLALLQDLQAEKDQLSQANSQIQVKLVDYICRKTGEGRRPEQQKVMSDLQRRYQTYLDITGEVLKCQRMRELEPQQQKEEELRTQSQETLEQVEQERRALMELKYELAVTALKHKLCEQAAQEQLQQAEQKEEEQLAPDSLQNTQLKMRTQELETVGLQPIDYEPLKIENQTYNEKIEEGNEELLKLRKTITDTVQVETHMKEKLQFVQVENQAKWAQLAEVDAALSWEKDALTETEQERDVLRADNLCLREGCGLLGNETLLRDLEEEVDGCESLESRQEKVQRFLVELILTCAGVKNKLENCRTEDH